MKLQEALSNIHAPKGVTSMIAGVMSGDFDPIRNQDAAGASLAMAKAELERVQKAQQDCKSDWAYWGYQGDISYWRAVVAILEAAALVGPDSLPDLPAPELENRVVMDACAVVETYGADMLAAARKVAERSA